MIGDDGIARLREAPSELIGERFEIAGEAGTGGMGVVYRARDTTTGATVALKVMTSESRSGGARFAREGHVLAALSHPAIVSYVAHGETEEGEPWLAMEWLDGVSLARRLGEGPLEWRAAVTLGRRIAEALEHAHAAGVVHRDLKPANLFLVGGRVEDVKLLDFGVARAESEGAGLTRTGEILGTPGYMAPEQARGGRDVDARADLFSLGCVLYRAISGEPAFEGADALEALAKLVIHEPAPIRRFAPDAPAALERLIARMMAKSPGDRPATAREVAAALERAACEAHDAPAEGRTPSAEELAATIESRSELTVGRHTASVGMPTHSGATRVNEARVSVPAPSVALPPRGWLARGVAIGIVLGAVVAGSALLDDGEAPRGREVSAPAADAIAEPAARACLAWIDALASAQHPDGTFGFERQRAGHGWTTGQELFALARADGACGSAPRHEVALRRGAAGLERFRSEHGYRGANAESGAAETGATAWAVLALVTVAERLDDPSLRERAVEARHALLEARTADGGFRLLPSEPDWPAHPYATLLALWALVESESLDPSAEAIEARRDAVDWLRNALREEGDLSMRAIAGLSEQATWVLLRAGDRDRELLESLARSMLARCDRDGDGCRRPIDGDGAIALDRGTGEDGPNFITHWHPWATLASDALSREGWLPGDVRAGLGSLARWGAGEMDRGRAPLRTAASYRLAEYLFVASELARN